MHVSIPSLGKDRYVLTVHNWLADEKQRADQLCDVQIK